MASYQRELDTSRTPSAAEQGGHRCRWSTNKRNKRPNLHFIVEGSGFILARRATHGSEGDWKPVIDMLGQLPIKPESLGIQCRPLEETSGGGGVVVARFTYHGDHLVCPEGKVLRRRAEVMMSLQKDCQNCENECAP